MMKYFKKIKDELWKYRFIMRNYDYIIERGYKDIEQSPPWFRALLQIRNITR